MSDFEPVEMMNRMALLRELRTARRYLWATGRNSWPNGKELRRMEEQQDKMRRERGE